MLAGVEQQPIFKVTVELLSTLAHSLALPDALTTQGGK